MPQVIGGFVVEILLFGNILSQQTINRFFYHSTSFTDPISDLIDEFDANVVAYLTSFMNQNAAFLQIQAQTVQNGSSFGSKNISEVGAGTGDCLPPFVSWDFTLVRGGALERNGYKRIAGVGEGAQVNGIPTSGILAVINAGVGALFGDLATTGDTWSPVIRRTRVNKVPVIPPQYFSVSSVQFSKIGSQNSRKYGHGR